ncbi:hypothetical protein SESBI_33004 [Sesbania bispinosa]|nr:hypothetical protein SESBI_33004 [Sesbania bispinosa]
MGDGGCWSQNSFWQRDAVVRGSTTTQLWGRVATVGQRRHSSGKGGSWGKAPMEKI